MCNWFALNIPPVCIIRADSCFAHGLICAGNQILREILKGKIIDSFKVSDTQTIFIAMV